MPISNSPIRSSIRRKSGMYALPNEEMTLISTLAMRKVYFGFRVWAKKREYYKTKSN
jgi:hypothetical protein